MISFHLCNLGKKFLRFHLKRQEKDIVDIINIKILFKLYLKKCFFFTLIHVSWMYCNFVLGNLFTIKIFTFTWVTLYIHDRSKQKLFILPEFALLEYILSKWKMVDNRLLDVVVRIKTEHFVPFFPSLSSLPFLPSFSFFFPLLFFLFIFFFCLISSVEHENRGIDDRENILRPKT